MIKVTFLGTSYNIPTAKRNHTSIFLNYKGENILVDCGEGTQRQFRKAKLNPCKLTRILITHIHGDHILGLPGLMQTLSLSNYNKTLFIYGPKGIKLFIERMMKAFIFELNYNVKVLEVQGKFFENEDFYLEAKRVVHGVPCNAYSFNEKSKLRIDKTKIKKSGLPSSELMGKLKLGKNVVYKGKKYLAKNLTFMQKGKKISFVLDALFDKKIISFVKESDLLICEATFHSEIKEDAKKKKHLTAEQAGEIAKKSKSKKLLLTHISQRYENDLPKLLKDARKKFKNTSIVHDFESFEI